MQSNASSDLRPRQKIARLLIGLVGLLLCLVGVVHDIVNIRSLQRVAVKGMISERMARELIANVAFGGAAVCLFGVILLVVAYGVGTANRELRWIGILIGTFFVIAGVAGYFWLPVPQVLLFSVLGALVAIPLLLWGGRG